MEELQKLINDINTKYVQMEKDGATAKELADVQSSLETLKSSSESEIESILKVLKTHGELIDGNKGNKPEFTEGENAQITKFVSENAQEIKEAMRNGTYVEFDVKATTYITSDTGSLEVNPRALGPLTNTNLRNADLMKYVNVTETGRSQFSYSEAEPTSAVALTRAEGDTAIKLDLIWKETFVQPTIMSAYMGITEESADDVVGLASLVRNTLRKQHDIAVEKDVYFGDGISPNSKGATVFGTVFGGTDMMNLVKSPTLLDVVNACVVDIAGRRNYINEEPYGANVAFINPIDFFLNFAAKKDANGLPVYPNASLFNEVKIGTVTIVPTFRMATDAIFVGDMTKYNVVTRKSYVVKIGLINDDFIRNQKAILGQSRYYAYVQKLDEVAFTTDVISRISDYIDIDVISTLATPPPSAKAKK